MKKLWLLAAAALAVIALISGGTDAKDINRMIFVSGIGIDRSEEGSGYRYTFHTAVPTGSDTAVSDNNVKYESVTLPGDSMAQALRSLEMNSSRDISLEHLNCTALGASVMGEDIPALLDHLLRDPAVRRQCALLALECSAEEFFSAEYSGSIASGAASLLEQQDDSGSRRSIMTLGRLSGAAQSSSGYSLYILRTAPPDKVISDADISTPAQLELRGLALYDSSGLTGRLTAPQAELARLFTAGQASGVIATVDEQGSEYRYEIRSSVCRTGFRPGIPALGTFDIEIECMLVDAQGSHPPDDVQLSRAVYSQLNELLELSRSVGSAFTGLETEAMQSCRGWYLPRAHNWEEIYRSAVFELNVACRTVGSGG